MHTESKERTKNDSTFLTPSKKKHQHSESIEIDKKIEALVYPGLCGSLHRMQQKEFPYNSTLRNLLEELSFDQQMDLAYMFSYIDETNLLRRRVSLQLDDSNWTRPFSLDSVGVNQVLFVNHPIRGRMEIGFKTSVAPGRLAKYTRIVRLLPRFIIVNNLSSNLRVLQPNGFAGEVSETTVLANHIQPYHLPAVFGERQLSLEVDGSWARSVPFSIDQTGVFTVKVQKNIDLASVQHINTRGATEYTVQLPFLKSLGVWFETDWGETNIVVKSLQPGSFAAIKTDIQVGDVLLAVNDELVDGKDFDGAISKIKAIISTDGGFLTFRTVEEKMRLLRETAMYQHAVKDINTRRRPSVLVPAFSQDSHDLPDQYELEQSNEIMQAILSKTSVDCMILKVELRPVESSIAIIVQEQNLEVQPEYRIENKSVCYVIHIKQKGVKGNTWITLNPGQSIAYVLDDPFKQHKLQILVGKNLLCPVMYNRNNSNHFISNRTKDLSSIGNGDDGLGSYLSYLAGVSLDSCTVIDIDRIGAKAFVNIPSADVKLVAIVKSEGPTKILSILPGLDNQILIRELRYTTEFINEQMHQIDNIREKIEAILSSLGEEDSDRASSFRATGGSFSEAVDYTVASLVASEMENAVTYLKERQKKLVEVNDQFQSDSRVPLRRNQGDIRDDTNTCKGTTLTSYAPFEELLGSEITSKHQLLVDVLEAKDLTVSSTGNVADTYCKVYIRADDPAFFNRYSFTELHFF